MLDLDFPRKVIEEVLRQIGFKNFLIFPSATLNLSRLIDEKEIMEVLCEARKFFSDISGVPIDFEIPDLTNYEIPQIAALMINLFSEIRGKLLRDDRHVTPYHYKNCKVCFNYLIVFVASVMDSLENGLDFSVAFFRSLGFSELTNNKKSHGEEIKFICKTPEQMRYIRELIPLLNLKEIRTLESVLRNLAEEGNFPEDLDSFIQIVKLAVAGVGGNQIIH